MEAGIHTQLAYRKMLVDLGHMLSERDFQSLKYMCRDFIPRGRLEDILQPQELWDALEEREKLSASDVMFLKTLLISATEARRDVLTLIANYEALGDPHTNASLHSTGTPVSGWAFQTDVSRPPQRDANILNREVNYIVKTIGRDWRQFVRALGVCEADIEYISEQYPRDLREKIRQTLLLWQGQNNGTANKDALIYALKDCERNDMVYELSRGQY